MFVASDLNARCKTFFDSIPDVYLEQIVDDIPYASDSFEIHRMAKDGHRHNLFGKSLV